MVDLARKILFYDKVRFLITVSGVAFAVTLGFVRVGLFEGLLANASMTIEKIGCCIDTGHFLLSREDPVRAAEVFGKRTYGVHLKDVKNATEFTILGQGDLRTADLLKVLAQNHYNYCLALEYEEHPENPEPDVRECLKAVREAAATLKKG